MSEHGYIIDTMAWACEKIQAAVMEFADYLGNALTEWLGGLLGACTEKCGQVTTAAILKVNEFRTPPSSTPSMKPDISPAISRSPEVSAPSQGMSPSVHSALSEVNFACLGDNFSRAHMQDLDGLSVGDEGTGCATPYGRYSKSQGMQIA